MGCEAAPRSAVEAIIEEAIAALDRLDGDPDLESPGAEDDFEIPAWQLRAAQHGAGCPIADPDYAVDDKPCDALTEDGV